ncbi:MAG: carcinine hydrolase/isopenicillin-N N-acyltransferase family protein [Candidatus Odinarchaeota archaeon]
MPSLAGAVILPELKKTLLFKNRDMISQNHRDEIFYDVDCFGIRGINNATGKVEGITIGINRHGLAIANTHVKSTPDPSFHKLTEQLLMFAKDAEDCVGMTVDQLKTAKGYPWGNLVLADLDSMLVIELAGSDHSLEWSERRVLRTSHHIMLDTEDVLRNEGIDYESSVKRVERGYELIRHISKVQDVFLLLKDHGDSEGRSSLCRHPEGDDSVATIMSYVIEIDQNHGAGRPKVIFHFAKGNPCRAVYATMPIVFPADEDTMKRATDIYHSKL